jgi:hypothetical protein
MSLFHACDNSLGRRGLRQTVCLPGAHQPLRTPCLSLHNATHITQRSKKKSKKGSIRNKPDINQL